MAGEGPTGRDILGVIAPPPLIYLGGLALGFLLEILLPGASLPGALHWGLGGVLLATGLGLLGWWMSSFRRADTPLPPYEPTTVPGHRRSLSAEPQPRVLGIHPDLLRHPAERRTLGA